MIAALGGEKPKKAVGSGTEAKKSEATPRGDSELGLPSRGLWTVADLGASPGDEIQESIDNEGNATCSNLYANANANSNDKK